MEEPIMALIQLNLMEQVFAPLQKKIVGKTDAMVPIEGENMRPVTWVPIEEICSLEWSIGGRAITTDALPALAPGKK
jgi:4-oxalocrotonate tautomerase